MKNTADTRELLLDATQMLIQTRGYNAFSYADLTQIVNIRKASIHYHFPTKVDLGVAVTRRYRKNFSEQLASISELKISWIEKIGHYANLYKNVLNENRLCLCAALASDIQTLPLKLQNETRGFLTDNVAWLSQIINKKNSEAAHMILSTLQGGMMLAKSLGNVDDTFNRIIKELVYKLKT